MAAENVLSSNFDIIFLILSLLPTETLVRAKSVCRAWAQVISDPVFARAHCSRPVPIAAFFVLNTLPRSNRIGDFRKVTEGAKFPNSLLRIPWDKFRPVSGNHGLLCFRQERTFLIGNPVTSQWVVVRDTNPGSGYEFCGAALLYDPEISLHFKLAVAMARLDENDDKKLNIRFHIYSSENSSWVVSSVGTGQSQYHLFLREFQIVCNVFKPSKIGGGSVCWMGEFGYLMVYEIATDTYWKTKPRSDITGIMTVTGYNGIIFYLNNHECDARVWRLEEKNSWILDGECSYMPRCSPFAYDYVRGALLVGDLLYQDIIAFDLERSEVLHRGAKFFKNMLVLPHVPHANTLAPFYAKENLGLSFMETRRNKCLSKNFENECRVVTYKNLGFLALFIVCFYYGVTPKKF